MMERDIEKNTLLVERIAAILEEGIAVTGDVAHFIESTFGRYTAEILRMILSDPENTEVETLFELLLYPNEAVQLKVETLLEKAEYTDADVDAVIERLTRSLVRIVLRFPGGTRDVIEEIVMDVPAWALDTLIERLNITRRIAPSIAGALARRLPDKSDILQTRVRLRNARFVFSEPVTGFLCDLIEKTHDIPMFFREAVAFAIDFLDETDPRTDIYSALMEKKRIFRRMIRHALATEKILRENPPEVVMMKGNPILCIDADDARNRIALIDRICTMIFGRNDGSMDVDPEPMSATLRVDPDQADFRGAMEKMDKILKGLS